MNTDPRVDYYIERQADFARPILEHLRETVHAACPECEETLKWGMPYFLYKKEMLAGMAAFKQHATFGFWRGSLVVESRSDPAGGMGQFGKLISTEDLPPRVELEALVSKAMRLTDEGVKPARARKEKPALTVPEAFRSALEVSPAAAANFAAFPPGSQREYVEWINEAKREETRSRRVAQAISWLAEGKKRHWKYEDC